MRFIFLLFILVGSVSLFSKPPNVVLLFADDLGTLDLNCYGSSDLHTPNLDQLARQGIRFTQAYAHSVCCPARAMLLTGRYPQRGGINTWTQGNMHDNKGANLALSEYTMAEMLKDQGYQTALLGKWHLGAHRDFGPTHQGFDYFWGHRGGFIDNYNHYFLHGEGFHDLYEGTREVMDHAGQYFPDMMTRRAIDFIKKNKSKPFFAYCSFNLPHYPEQADKKFDQTYKDMQNPQRQAYAKVVSTMDDRIGWIINALEELDLRKNTILIFMSDNGHSNERNQIRVDNHKSGLAKGTPYGANGGGGNTGKWKGSKFTYFEGGLRVPSIISWPSKIPENEVRNQPISAMDWLPTIQTMTNASLPTNLSLDGYDLSDIIRSPVEPSKYTAIHWMFGQNWAVLEGNWKLIGQGNDPHFLGNLSDPKPEQFNHLAQESTLVSRLHNLHQKWAKEVQPTTR